MSTTHKLDKAEESMQAAEGTHDGKQLTPFIIENPLLVRKVRCNNRLLIVSNVLISFNIFLSVLFLSMIYGNQSQMFRSANKNQILNEMRTTETCINTAEIVAEKVTSEMKVQSEDHSTKSINQLRQTAKSAENKKAQK